MRKFQLFLCFAIFFCVLPFMQGQKYIVDFHTSYATGLPHNSWQGTKDNGGHIVETYNFHLGVSRKVYKNLHLRLQFGGADHDFNLYTRYGDYTAWTLFDNINQKYVGLYPEFVVHEKKNMYMTIGGGPDLYLVSSAVANHQVDIEPPVFYNHPQLRKSRLGFNAYINFYGRIDEFGFLFGFGYKYNELFKEQRYFPSITLGLMEFKFGISYFLDEKENKEQVPND